MAAAPPVWHPHLDGLRGLAALAIVLYHLRIPHFLGGGQQAMEIFFVLSGFLITSVLLREHTTRGRIALKAFYLRRARRLLPALVALVATVMLLSFFLPVPGREQVPRAALAAILYVFNWWEMMPGHDGGLLSQVWSLSIEEQFYIAWPLVLLGILLLAPRRRLVVTGALVAAFLAVRVWFALSIEPERLIMMRNSFHTRAFALLLGCFVALALPTLARAPKLIAWGAGVGTATVIVIPAAVTSYTPITFVTWWLGSVVASAFIIAHLAQARPGDALKRALAWKPLLWLGLISYSLYLWHPVAIWAVEFAMPEARWHVRSPIALIASLALAWGSYALIERRFWRPPQERYQVLLGQDAVPPPRPTIAK